jgi:hypothetical protein
LRKHAALVLNKSGAFDPNPKDAARVTAPDKDVAARIRKIGWQYKGEENK